MLSFLLLLQLSDFKTFRFVILQFWKHNTKRRCWKGWLLLQLQKHTLCASSSSSIVLAPTHTACITPQFPISSIMYHFLPLAFLSPTSADFRDYVQSPPGQARNISCSRVLHFIVSPEPLFLYAVTFHMSRRLQFGYLLERTLFRLLHCSTKELYLFDPQMTCHLKYNV